MYLPSLLMLPAAYTHAEMAGLLVLHASARNDISQARMVKRERLLLATRISNPGDNTLIRPLSLPSSSSPVKY
jgi:hypothetical protein